MAIKVVDSPLPETTLHNIGEFPLVDEFGDEILNLPQEELERCVALANERFADTGDMSPLILGHTDKDKPEAQQPPIVGYLRNFRLGTLGKKNPRPAIYAEHLMLPEWKEKIKQYPRRSIEFWGDDGLIDPVAALGATTPHRSLGLALSKCRYKVAALGATTPQRSLGLAMKANVLGEPTSKRRGSEQHRNKSKRALSRTEDTMADANEIQEAVAGMPLFQQLNSLLPVLQKMCQEYAEDAAELEEPEANADEHLEEPEANADEHLEEPADEPVPQLDAVPGGGGAPNTHVADDKLRRLRKPNRGLSARETKRLQRTQDSIRLDRLEKANALLEKQLKDQARQLRKKEREAELTNLLIQGYDLNLAEELADAIDMRAEQFSKHLNRIRASYRKNPRGPSPIGLEHMASLPSDADSQEAQAKLAKKAGEYAEKHGIPFERFKEAVAAVKAGKS